MALDPRTPVLVGVGQVTVAPGEISPPERPEPLELMVQAVQEAWRDAGARSSRLVEAVESIRVVRSLQWNVPNPGALVAQRLGVTVRESLCSTIGGNSPQALLAASASAIQAGQLDAVIVVGAECGYSRAQAQRSGQRLAWSTQDPNTAPAITFGVERAPLTELELSYDLALPVHCYPLFENALRMASGWRLSEHQARIGSLWSRFSQVAASNPYAWIRTPRSPTEVIQAGPHNRMVAFPYPKLCTANIQVDQGAACICCSAEVARAAGTDPNRWVFPVASAEANDHWFISERPELFRSPAIALAGRAALALAGLGIDDIALGDLYSCFPIAVQMAANELGIPIDGDINRLTLTGGLTFGGGPGNNYTTHGIASVVQALRHRSGATALATGLGWYATKHAIGVYSTEPPRAGFRTENVQEAVDRLEKWDADPHASGRAEVETFTVIYDHQGEPKRGVVSCRTGPYRRTWAEVADQTALAALAKAEEPYLTGTLRGDGSFELEF